MEEPMTSGIRCEGTRALFRVFLSSALLISLILKDHSAKASPTRDAQVDVALVLAIDTSDSVSAEELELQLGGTAAAITDPDVVAAMLSGPRKSGAITFVIWGDSRRPSETGPWHIIRSEADAVRFAARLARVDRRIGGSTGVAQALLTSLSTFRNMPFNTRRMIIDISGDGRESPQMPKQRSAPLLDDVRALAVSQGVTVNGLAVVDDDKELRHWYLRNVTAGAGSFVMEARDFTDFRRVLRLKLIREFSDEPVVADNSLQVVGTSR
jgi:hypothetical protein